MDRNGQHDTAQKLRDATITSEDGTSRPLLPDGTSDTTLSGIAQTNAQLKTIHDALDHPDGQRRLQTRDFSKIGDLFSFIKCRLEDEVEKVFEATVTNVNGVWNFVCRGEDTMVRPSA